MSGDKVKGVFRQLLEEGPQEPLLIEKLTLLERLQKAHGQGDTRKMLEIGKELAANAKEIELKRAKLRSDMSNAIEETRRVADPDLRTQKFLDVFDLCAKTQVIAKDHLGDLETQNLAIQQTFAAVEELDAIPPGRRAALAAFLEHADADVRVFAAAYLFYRDLMLEKVIPILKEAERQPVGAASSIAFQALHLPRMPAKS